MKKRIIITLLSLILTLALSISVSAIYAGSRYFDDLSEDDWACKIADAAYENGYMFGVGGEYFAPKREVTYAELVTVLYRLAGTPKVSDPTTGDHKWYHLEILWGESIGIIDRGVTDPESIATREGIVKMIYDFALHKGLNVSAAEDKSVLEWFVDSDTLPEESTAQWCYVISHKIIEGDGYGHLMPNGTLTREQLAAIVIRLDDISALNRPDSELWNIPVGETVITEAPENADSIYFSVDRITNRYLIENEKGEYICTTDDVTLFENDSNKEWCPYVYGTIPCYGGEYIFYIPYPFYYFVIPDSESFSVTPMNTGNVDFSFNGFSLEGYGIEKITYEGDTVTIYGSRATLTKSNADKSGYTVVFADK